MCFFGGNFRGGSRREPGYSRVHRSRRWNGPVLILSRGSSGPAPVTQVPRDHSRSFHRRTDGNSSPHRPSSGLFRETTRTGPGWCLETYDQTKTRTFSISSERRTSFLLLLGGKPYIILSRRTLIFQQKLPTCSHKGPYPSKFFETRASLSFYM